MSPHAGTLPVAAPAFTRAGGKCALDAALKRSGRLVKAAKFSWVGCERKEEKKREKTREVKLKHKRKKTKRREVKRLKDRRSRRGELANHQFEQLKSICRQNALSKKWVAKLRTCESSSLWERNAARRPPGLRGAFLARISRRWDQHQKCRPQSWRRGERWKHAPDEWPNESERKRFIERSSKDDERV